MRDDLIRAAAAGDEAAFAQLVAEHQDRVYHLALRLCRDPEDAQDVAQEAFLAAWRGLPRFRGEAEFTTWLHRLVHNAAIDHLRKTRNQRTNLSLDDDALPLDLPDTGPGPQRAAEESELKDTLAAALDQLGEDHRRVLVLREMHQLSYDEIAHRLDLDIGTVKSRLSRARTALRKILLKNGNLSGYLPSNGKRT